MPKAESFCSKCRLLVFPDGDVFHELTCPFNSSKIDNRDRNEVKAKKEIRYAKTAN